MSVTNGKFTPTQRRILAVLADGEIHHHEELVKCLDDELATKANVNSHIDGIRRIIRPAGQDIVCQYYYRRFYYRQVRLLNRSE